MREDSSDAPGTFSRVRSAGERREGTPARSRRSAGKPKRRQEWDLRRWPKFRLRARGRRAARREVRGESAPGACRFARRSRSLRRRFSPPLPRGRRWGHDRDREARPYGAAPSQEARRSGAATQVAEAPAARSRGMGRRTPSVRRGEEVARAVGPVSGASGTGRQFDFRAERGELSSVSDRSPRRKRKSRPLSILVRRARSLSESPVTRSASRSWSENVGACAWM